jgi:tight adherence protein C
VSAAGLLAASAVVLACAALRELRRAGAAPALPFGLGGHSARAALRLGLPERLRRSGLGSRLSLATVLAAKLAGSACGGLAALMAAPAAPGRTGVLVAIALPAAGFLLPDALLERRARRRRRQLLGALPDALDLLAVSVEAGLGFDGAIAKLTEHLDGPLVEEFTLTLNEMRIGESRHDALKKLSERAAAPEVGHFTRAIIQADHLGISLGRILKVQAADTRERRQAAAEEKAMKAPIKMLFPTVLFIFPAMFLVILGPAMLTINEIF